jgi:hypothetical protein
MITDMSVELQPFSPGEQPEQPSPEELEEDIAGNDKLAPMLDKLKDFENFVGKLSGGECASGGNASQSAADIEAESKIVELRSMQCNVRQVHCCDPCLSDAAQGASASWASPSGSRPRRRCSMQQSTTRCMCACIPHECSMAACCMHRAWLVLSCSKEN